MEGETNGDRDPNTHLEQDISIHMFTVSSAMMGVCLTVIGLIRVVITLGLQTLWRMTVWPETHYCCWSPVCFLTGRFAREACVECMVADGILIAAMVGMVGVCALITYTVSVPAQ